MQTMRMRLTILTLALGVLMPSVVHADATVFIGRNAAGDDRSVVRGFAIGVSLLIVGFEFEYGSSSEDEIKAVPSLKTTSGIAYLQTIGLPGFQLYSGDGRRRLSRASPHGSGNRVPTEYRRRREDQSRRPAPGAR